MLQDYNSQLVESVKTELWIWRLDFQLHGVSAPLTPVLLEGQLYLKMIMIVNIMLCVLYHNYSLKKISNVG